MSEDLVLITDALIPEGEPKDISNRDKIALAEAEILKHEQVDLPPVHHFAKGLYARELFIPAGTILTGKIHKHEHINIISQGAISVLTEAGFKLIEAPFTMVSLPGTKRLGYAHTDTVWTTVHINEADTQDLVLLEENLISKTHEEVEHLSESDIKELKEVVCLGWQQQR